MMITARTIINTILLAAVGLLLWLFLFGIAGCEFFRKAQRSSSDTVAVVKTNEVATKVDTSVTKKSSEYEKISFTFPPGDTTVINNYFPAFPAMPRPTVITVEKGQAQEQTNTFNYETLLKWKIDSLAASQKNSTVTTKAALLNPWHFIVIGGILLGALVIWLRTKK